MITSVNTRTWTRRLSATFLAAALLVPNLAWCAVYINKTRIIVHETQREETFTVRNEDSLPVLLQTWLDTGDIAAKPEDIVAPFIVTPTLFRSEPGRAHTFRLLFTGEKNRLAANREQVYWLNVLEIPPKQKHAQNQIQLQMAFRSRIKVFYRPAALQQANINNEVLKLRASLTRSGNTSELRIDNPGPLHITFISLTVNNGPKITQIPQDGMVAPFSSLRIPLAAAAGHGRITLQFEYLDDYGEIRACCNFKTTR